MTIIATQDLLCDERYKRFTKGKEYEVINFPLASSVNEHMRTTNDSGHVHCLGNWYKHFKIKK